MRIEHAAVWTRDLDRLTAFYETYFRAQVGPKYVNPSTRFASHFLSFASGARLELMQMPALAESPDRGQERFCGYAHLAFSVGSKDEVEALTARLRADGARVLDGPRWTGDGYYESRVLDCDGNAIEITI